MIWCDLTSTDRDRRLMGRGGAYTRTASETCWTTQTPQNGLQWTELEDSAARCVVLRRLSTHWSHLRNTHRIQNSDSCFTQRTLISYVSDAVHSKSKNTESTQTSPHNSKTVCRSHKINSLRHNVVTCLCLCNTVTRVWAPTHARQHYYNTKLLPDDYWPLTMQRASCLLHSHNGINHAIVGPTATRQKAQSLLIQ